MGQRCKTVGAILVLVSILLPMSTCTTYRDSQGQVAYLKQGEPIPEGVIKKTEYNWALEHFEPTRADAWHKLSLFVWPIFAAIFLVRRPRGKVALGVRVLELPLALYSIWAVEFISTFLTSGRAIGAYTAIGGLSLYVLGAIWADAQLLRIWRNERRT